MAIDKIVIKLTKFTIYITCYNTNTASYPISDGWKYDVKTLTLSDIIKLFDVDAENTTESDFVANIVKYFADDVYSAYEVVMKSNGYDL